jgi:hypothetical protein
MVEEVGGWIWFIVDSDFKRAPASKSGLWSRNMVSSKLK